MHAGRVRSAFLERQQAAFYAGHGSPAEALRDWRRTHAERESHYMEEAWTGRRTSMAGIVAARGPATTGPGPEPRGRAPRRRLRVMILDVPNRSSLPFLDEEAIVEVPCIIGRGGSRSSGDRECAPARAGPDPLRPARPAGGNRGGALGVAGDGDQGTRAAPAGPVGQRRRADPRRLPRGPAGARGTVRRGLMAQAVRPARVERSVDPSGPSPAQALRDPGPGAHGRSSRIRFSCEPADMGSEHEANGLSLTLFDPVGFRGVASRDRENVVGESAATLGSLAGPMPPGTWALVVSTARSSTMAARPATRVPPRGIRHHCRCHGGATAGARRRPAAGGPPSCRGWWPALVPAATSTRTPSTATARSRSRTRVRGAVERGLDFLAITDHNTISHHREVDAGQRRSPRSGAARSRPSTVTSTASGSPGNRLARRDAGAAARRGSPSRRTAGRPDLDQPPERLRRPVVHGCHWDFARVDYSTFDAIEVWNGRLGHPETDNDSALALWTDLLDAGFRPTAVSGTDSHSARRTRRALPFNHVHAGDRSEAAILDGIRRGHVLPAPGRSCRSAPAGR